MTPMSLRFAILTALSEKESTGSELARRFDRSFAYFWSTTHQQIYRELDQLERAGWVLKAEDPAQESRGRPRTFSITERGTEELCRWLASEPELPRVRDVVGVRLRAAAVLGDPEAVRPLLTEQLERHRARLAEYERIEQRDFATEPDVRTALQHLVLRSGMTTESGGIQWCEEALRRLDRLAEADSAADRPVTPSSG